MKSIQLLIVLFACSTRLLAQPANDDCANAISLTPSVNLTCTPTPGTNTGVVTADYDNCVEFEKRNVWYKFIAGSTTHVVRVVYSTMTNGIVDVYTGNCGTLTNVESCNSGVAGPINETLVSGLVVGQEYKIAVSTREQTQEGDFEICVITPPPPPNDECATAVSLTMNPSNVPVDKTSGSTLFATQSLPGCSGTADDDVWYSFVATQSNHRVHLFYTGNTMTLEAFSGICGSLIQIHCSSPSGLFKTAALTGLTAGQTYFIRVYSNSSAASAQGSFQIAITSAPQNDECASPVGLTPSSNGTDICGTPAAGATFDATQSSLDCFGGSSTSNDTWYSFTATQGVHKIKVFGFGSNSIRFQVMSGNCAGLVSLFCNLPLFSGDTAFTTVGGLTVGQVYLLRVYSGNGGGVEGLFNVCITSPVFPPNDECINAVSLIPAVDSTINFVNGTLKGATNVMVPGSCSSTGTDVWYQFTASSRQHVVKALNLTNTTSLFIELFSGTSGSLVHQRCAVANDTLFGIGNLVIGQTYFVRIISGSTFFGDDFSIAVFTPQALVNDECSNAIVLVPTPDASCNEIGGTIFGATQSQKENICYGNTLIGQVSDAWYQFNASSSSHRVRLIKGTGTLAFQVFSGNCGSLVSIACSAVLSGLVGSSTELRLDGLAIGNTYFIRVLNTGPDATGTFDLCVKTVVIPVNNECATPTILTPQSNITFGNFTVGITTDATTSAQPTNCSTGQDDDVWYQFTASQSTMQVVLQNGTVGSTRIAVYSGSCGALTLVKCQAGNTRDNFVPLTGLSIGTNYLVRVYSISTTTTQGTFSIMVTTQYAPPPNDDCINATELFPSAGNNCNTVQGSTIDAAASGNASCANGNEVWYRFIATSTSHRVNVDGFVNTPFVTVFSGTCAGLVQLPSVCAAGNYQVSTTANSLTIGNTYFVKVVSSGTAAFSQSIFNICITTPQVPVNNECGNAISLTVDNDATTEPSQLFSTNLATFSSGAPNCTVTGNDVWFSFVAPSEPVTVEVNALSTNAAVQLLSGNCSSLTSVQCNGTNPLRLNNVVNTSGLIAGDTYFVRVNSTTVTPLAFKIKVYKNLPANLNNNIDTICLSANLVQNPGIETDLFFPTEFVGAINPGSRVIDGWRIPTRGTADFFNGINSNGSSVEVPFNICFGSQSARNGYGYAGFFAYTSAASSYREYLENELAAPMIPGNRYLVSMYVSLSDFSTIGIDNLGMALRTSATSEVTFAPLAYTPQVVSPDGLFLTDKKGWVNISAVIVADQPYRYLVIGNFKNNLLTDTLRLVDTSAALSGGTFSGCASTNHSAYYFIDDVVVSEVNGSVSGCGVLPIELVSFTATKTSDGKKVNLQWRSASEFNVSHFELQRSADGMTYQTIATIQARNDPGGASYQWVDEQPLSKTNYYRLRIVDRDAAVKLSPIRMVMFATEEKIRVLPTVTNGLVFIQTTTETVVQLYNAVGTRLETKKIQGNASFGMGKYAPGVYFIRTSPGNQSFKIVRQ